MAHWRALDEYTPFARILVEYMWAQRPPLLPAQFASQMGVRKQALSNWLMSDATPPPPVIVRLARAMGLPVDKLLIAAGHAMPDDPLMDTTGAWYTVLKVARTAADAGPDAALPADQATVTRVLNWLDGLQPRVSSSMATPTRPGKDELFGRTFTD